MSKVIIGREAELWDLFLKQQKVRHHRNGSRTVGFLFEIKKNETNGKGSRTLGKIF